MIIAGIIATALILVVAFIFAVEYESKRCVIQPLIPSEKNPDIIGDGAWTVTHAEYPKTARVRDIPDYQAEV